MNGWAFRPKNEGSCQYFLRNYLFTPLKIADKQFHLFNAMAKNTQKECSDMDQFIKDHGGIDLII